MLILLENWEHTITHKEVPIRNLALATEDAGLSVQDYHRIQLYVHKIGYRDQYFLVRIGLIVLFPFDIQPFANIAAIQREIRKISPKIVNKGYTEYFDATIKETGLFE